MDKNNKVVVFHCPYFNDCHGNADHFYYDNELKQSVSTIKCKSPFIVGKDNTEVCRIVIERDKFNGFEELTKQMKIYKKPFKEKIRNFFLERR